MARRTDSAVAAACATLPSAEGEGAPAQTGVGTLRPPHGAMLIAMPALGPALGMGNPGEGNDGGPKVCMRIKPASAFGADMSPLAGEQGKAEQVGPDLLPVEAAFVAFRPDPDQRGGIREDRQLGRGRPNEGCSAALGIFSRKMYHFRRCLPAKTAILASASRFRLRY
jgi:hypothetical protein